ncbi:ribonuclease H-like domain-containing protein [Lentinula edodes]|nr:ribonuclease H-like domain-containing protein [Lentinula edodes]
MLLEDYKSLKEASESFLKYENFGFVEVDEVMNHVFGSNRAGNLDAKAWAAYWTQLSLHEEKVRDDGYIGSPPEIPSCTITDSESIDIDDDEVRGQKQLSNEFLQNTTADRELERQEQSKNGNISPRQSKARNTGRSIDQLCMKLAIERMALDKKGKATKVYYCIGCDEKRSNNARAHALPHSMGCDALQRNWPKEFKEVIDTLAAQSGENMSTGKSTAPAVRGKKHRIETETEGHSSSTPTASDPQQVLEASWGEVQKLTPPRQARIDYFLLRFVVCCAVAFAILDSGFFQDFVHALCPAYSLPDCSNFFTTHIAAEAANVATLVLNYLAKFTHLTISYDGWSSLLGDEIYTVHITTPLRRSFLVDGLILTGKSTDADSLFTLLSALNLMMKDIMVGSKKYPKIIVFTEAMRIVSAITTYFSHSNYRKYQLREEHKNEPHRRGIQIGGATRFSTFATYVRSIIRCSDAMERCLSNGRLKFDTAATKDLRKYIANGPDCLKFQLQLHNIDLLLQPIAQGLQTLEGQNTTCSDVFFIFIGIAIGFNCVFQDPTSEIFTHREETFAIFDRRFDIFLNDCTKDMFILAYLLNPMYYADRALCLELPPRSAFKRETCRPLLHHLVSSALQMLRNEQKREQNGTMEDAGVLIKELTAYVYGESPFDIPVTDAREHLSWWKDRSKDSGARQISKLAIKLFSVSPSEMCDERSASKLSGLDTAKCNGLSGQNLIRMAQLQQYWRYGFSDPRYTHTARLELDNSSAHNLTQIQLPAPTLNDLLNPAQPNTTNENPSFDISDPYGAKALDEEEDSEDKSGTDDMDGLPIIVRAQMNRLKIESIVNLSNSKLLECYNPSPATKDIQKEKPSTSGSHSQKTLVAKDVDWSPKDLW